MKYLFMNDCIIDEDMQDIYHREIDWNLLRCQTVLVTGATGMLASYVVYFLIYLNEVYKFDINIIVLVRNLEKTKVMFKEFTTREYFHVLTDDINKTLDISLNMDYIIHAASLASPQYYGPMPVEVAAPNALGTYYLLELAKMKKVKGFLYFSSGDIYGKMIEAVEITEDMSGSMDPLEMHSCYGESKRMGETWCASFAREYDVPTKIVRIGHTYGPTMDVEHDPRVFASFMKCVCDKKDIVMLSDGLSKRPFCYIVDAVAAFFLVLFKGSNGAAYNVCNTKEFLSIAELAALMVQLSPEDNLKVIKKDRDHSDVYLEHKGSEVNMPIETKLLELGWKQYYDSYTGFSRVFQYLKNRIYLQDNNENH